MKAVFVIVILVLIVALGAQIYFSFRHQRQLEEKYDVLEGKLKVAEEERVKLQTQLDYLANPENLEKELRARFNYKEQGEKLIILVPPSASSSEP